MNMVTAEWTTPGAMIEAHRGHPLRGQAERWREFSCHATALTFARFRLSFRIASGLALSRRGTNMLNASALSM